jgi:hypothetical protein
VLEFLKAYKVVFETVVATAPTAMAVVVSIAQLRQTGRQNRVAEAPLALTRHQHLPHIHAFIRYVTSPGSDSVADEMIVENIGGPLSGYG